MRDSIVLHLTRLMNRVRQIGVTGKDVISLFVTDPDKILITFEKRGD